MKTAQAGGIIHGMELKGRREDGMGIGITALHDRWMAFGRVLMDCNWTDLAPEEKGEMPKRNSDGLSLISLFSLCVYTLVELEIPLFHDFLGVLGVLVERSWEIWNRIEVRE